MPLLTRAEDLADDVTAWRRQLHREPELLFAVEKTASFVEQKLKEFGADEVVAGIGRTGVVGLVRGKKQGTKTIGLRADMDALPISEKSGKPWASTIAGKMHACGHDGHTAMLLGAAKYFCDTRDFAGSVAVIFQPAEEGGGGGDLMVRDGMMERFAIDEVYGMHNLPGLAVGEFAIRTGPIMAATDVFTITVKGRGGHAAMPHKGIDPIVIAAEIVSNLQTIVSRNVDPLQSLVVSVTKFQAGTATNVIPDQAELTGTVRTLLPDVQDMAEARIRQIATGLAAAHGAEAQCTYVRGYPVTVNHAEQTRHAADAATEIAGAAQVERDINPMMGAEDFSYMLKARPGAFIFIGNGDTAGLHNAAYDFNDAVIPWGVSYWARLAENRLAA